MVKKFLVAQSVNEINGKFGISFIQKVGKERIFCKCRFGRLENIYPKLETVEW